MLELKLAEASRQARIRRIRFALVLTSAAVLAGLFLTGVLRIDLATLGIGGGAASPEKNAGPVGDRLKSEAERAGGAAEPFQASQHEANTPRPGNADLAMSTSSLEEKRDAFKNALAAFDADIRPAVDAPGFSAWNTVARNQILSAREDAIQAFSASNYDPALSKLKQAALQAEQELKARDVAYDEAMNKAGNAFMADQFETAAVAIGEALRIKPDSGDALALKEKIDRLPEVLALVGKAVTARVENDLEGEGKLLKQILALAPDREDIKKRYGEVTAELNEKNFSRYISDGMINTEKRQLARAQDNLKKAIALFGNRAEVKLLSERVAILKRELDAEGFIAKAIKASAMDDYESAARLFEDAGKILPGNKDAADGLKLARLILALKDKMAQHIAAPERLAAVPVEKTARDLIKDAATLAPFSSSLNAKTVELSNLLDTYTRSISITVVSDGLTNISVRGVGVVGETSRRVIELRPGKYNFEGKRIGYRTKLVPVEVPPGINAITVEIACDERV